MLVRSFFIASLAAGLGILGVVPKAEAAIAGDVCRSFTEAAERRHGIPQGLLGAIALAESGGWNSQAKESRGWPWTVMARGTGTKHPSKQTALAHVAQLQAEGLTNIDVGCMQVNLGYHGHHFASVADAMEPSRNVAYAAQFLLEKQSQSESWIEAASHYHSKTPHLAAKYRAKVERLWADLKPFQPGGTQTAGTWGATVATAAPARVKPAAIDYQRTALLNDSLRKRRAAARSSQAALATRSKPVDQLTAWRMAKAAENRIQTPTGDPSSGTMFQGMYGQDGGQGQGIAQGGTSTGGLGQGGADSGAMASLNAANAAQIAALIRRAQLAAQEREELQGGTRTPDSFAQKRQADLSYWRRSNGLDG